LPGIVACVGSMDNLLDRCIPIAASQLVGIVPLIVELRRPRALRISPEAAFAIVTPLSADTTTYPQQQDRVASLDTAPRSEPTEWCAISEALVRLGSALAIKNDPGFRNQLVLVHCFPE